MFVTPSSHLRYWTRSLGRAHADLLAIAAEVVRPGMRVWDVGANVGVFTFAAAALAGAKGSVLGVEADVRMVSLLRRSARLAGGGGVRHRWRFCRRR